MTVVTFSFDDGDNSWIKAARILEKHGWRGTFNVTLRNVVPDLVKGRSGMFPLKGVLHRDQVTWLYKRGHEIASHGLRHLEPSRCNSVELWYELRASKKTFESYGVAVTSFACPFNGFNAAVEKASRGIYRSIRGKVGVNRLPVKGRVYHAVDNIGYEEVLKRAEKENLWVVLVWHRVKPSKFSLVADYVAGMGLTVKRVGDMV